MKKQIKQILYDMRTQPLIAWVTVIGTALSIFLIMTVVMIESVGVMSFSPESNRDRMLYGMYVHINKPNGSGGSGSMSYKCAERLYANLKGVEAISFQSDGAERLDIHGTTDETFTASVRSCDQGFWEVFDHKLLEGRLFSKEEVEAGSKLAVVSRSTARRLFGPENAIGRHFMLDHNDTEVIGVVEDSSPLAEWAYGEVFRPIDVISSDEWGGGYFGNIAAAILVEDGIDLESVRDQVKNRYAEFASELKAEGRDIIYHGAPFTQQVYADGIPGSNNTPDNSADRAINVAVLVILLLVPAINLSSMLHSRLRRRINDLGVRRAFGCTRGRIVRDIIGENFIVTLAGGLIGLGAGVLFALFYDGVFTVGGESVHPSLSMLLNFRIIFSAFAACFILNIISAAIPAWQAARMNPVNAINAK